MRTLLFQLLHHTYKLIILISPFCFIASSSHAETAPAAPATATTAATTQTIDTSKYDNKAAEFAVKGFANEAFMAGYNFTFVANNAEQLLQASHYFSPDAWNKFVIASDQDKMIKMATSTQAFITASATRTPSILNQGVLNRRYCWWVSFPAEVAAQGMVSERVIKHLDVQMLICTPSGAEGVRGMVVDNIIFNPANDKPTQ